MNKREYIQANKDWLMAKSKEDGVNALPKGIYYKVLSEGNPDTPKPTVRSIITAHYTGKTIDGNQFDSSRGGVPLACRLCDLIEGWIIAMQQMHIGDKWEIKPEYGSNRRIQVKLLNGDIAITNVHVGSMGDIITYPIDVDPDLNISKVQLLDAILHEISSNGFSDSEESDFWDDFDNLQKAKIVR